MPKISLERSRDSTPGLSDATARVVTTHLLLKLRPMAYTLSVKISPQERLIQSIIKANEILEFGCKSLPAPTQFLKLQKKKKRSLIKVFTIIIDSKLGTISNGQGGAHRSEQVSGVWSNLFCSAVSQLTTVPCRPSSQDPSF